MAPVRAPAGSGWRRQTRKAPDRRGDQCGHERVGDRRARLEPRRQWDDRHGVARRAPLERAARGGDDSRGAAFRRVVDICRPLARRAKFMWSPQGEPGLAAYYPGNAYVDEIGLSLFALQRYDRDKYGRDRSFAEMLKPKYERVAGFGKPICIAELGYPGDEAYNRRWARAITAKNAAFPDLGCVVYFDENDPHAWPAPYGKPHWRIKSSDGD